MSFKLIKLTLKRADELEVQEIMKISESLIEKNTSLYARNCKNFLGEGLSPSPNPSRWEGAHPPPIPTPSRRLRDSTQALRAFVHTPCTCS